MIRTESQRVPYFSARQGAECSQTFVSRGFLGPRLNASRSPAPLPTARGRLLKRRIIEFHHRHKPELPRPHLEFTCFAVASDD